MIKSLKNLTVSERFVVLALAAEMVLKEQPVVFYYFGPARLKRLATSLKGERISTIIDELRELESGSARLDFLSAQIRSLRAYLKYSHLELTGEALLSAVKEVTDVDAPPPYDLNAPRRELGRALTEAGSRNIAEFKKMVSQKYRLVSDPEIQKFVVELKNYCKKDIIPKVMLGDKMVELLDNSQIDLSNAKKGYPPCYYIYKGNGRAEISLSKDHKKNGLTVVQTLLHELYPGHHFYYLYRELLYNEGLLGEEATIDLLYSSETAINEGIAENAYKFLHSMNAGLYADVKAGILRDQFCKMALYNVWYLMFVARNMTMQGARRYLAEQAEIPVSKMIPLLELIDQWRLYYPAYPVGKEMVKNKRLYDLYLPRPLSVIKGERRYYEKEICKTNVHGGQLN